MQASKSQEYGYGATVDLPFEDAVARMEAGLKNAAANCVATPV